MMTLCTRLLAAALLTLALPACGKKEPPKPPERATSITVGRVTQTDLPVIESAVGMESALGQARDYDPTKVKANTFHVRLPFPEHVARQLSVGQNVRLTTFDDTRHVVTGQITEVRPALNTTTQSRDVMVAITSSQWRPLGSIRGEITLGIRRGALMVPEQAVVLRPAGAVVYVIEGEAATERPVRTGAARDGKIEIVSGLKAGESVAVDGASLLSGNARVKVRDNKP